MSASAISNLPSKAVAWGNGLGFRITKPLADAAGIALDTELTVSAQPGRIGKHMPKATSANIEL